MKTELTFTELKPFLTHMIKSNKDLQAKGIMPVAVELVGEAGIGKTTFLKSLALDTESHLEKISLSQFEELGDLTGYPTREFQMYKTVKNKEGVLVKRKAWIDAKLVEEFKLKGFISTGQHKMGYSKPEWVVNCHEAAKKGKGVIVLLDDFSRAQQRFIQATMEIIDQQEFISWKLPLGTTILLSSNPDNGDYQVTSQDEAQKTRYISQTVCFDIETWALWAEEAGIDERCINFSLMNAELFENEGINARSATKFFNSISTIENFSDELPLISMIGEGSVGPEFATMFSLFINNKLDKLLSPEFMLEDANYTKVRSQVKACTGTQDDYRADIGSVLSTRIVNYIKVKSQQTPPGKKLIDRVSELLSDQDLFSNDLNYFMARAIVGSHSKFKILAMKDGISQMITA